MKNIKVIDYIVVEKNTEYILGTRNGMPCWVNPRSKTHSYFSSREEAMEFCPKGDNYEVREIEFEVSVP